MSSFYQPTIGQFRPEHRRPLPEEESEDVAHKLLGYSTSALQTGLDVLDKPGRAVRGLLYGRPRELGNVVPLSDTFGITRPQDRVTGRDLTNAIGLTSKRDKGWGSWGAGLGADILTDPLTYATLGTSSALTGTGQALKGTGALRGMSRRALLEGFHDTESAMLARGMTPSQIAYEGRRGRRIATPAMEEAVAAKGLNLRPNEPLGALAGFGLPFRNPSVLVGGSGRVPRAIAGALDKAGHKLKYGTTIGRWGNALFDRGVRGSTGGDSQEAWKVFGAPAEEAAKIAGQEDVYKVGSAIHGGLAAGMPEEELLAAAVQSAEGALVRDPITRAESINRALPVRASEIGELAHRPEVRQLEESINLGHPLRNAADPYVNYLERQGLDLASGGDLGVIRPGRSGPQFTDRNNIPLVSGANFARESIYRAVPGGRVTIDALVKRFAGNPDTDLIRRAAKKAMATELIDSGRGLTREVGKQLDDKAARLAGRISELSPEYVRAGLGLYNPSLVHDVERSALQHARPVGAANMVYGFLGKNAGELARLGPNPVRITKLLSDLGLKTTLADPAAGTPIRGALVQAANALARKGLPNVDPLLNSGIGRLRRVVNRYGVSREHYNELLKEHARGSVPEVLAAPMGLFDSLTSAFKNLAYPLWPASHGRNLTSGLINNLAWGGTRAVDHALQDRLLRGVATAPELARVFPGVTAAMSDAEARDIARRVGFANADLYQGFAGSFDLDQHIASRLASTDPGRITPDLWGTRLEGAGSLPGSVAQEAASGLAGTAAEFGRKIVHPRTAANPLRMKGVFGSLEDFPALASGRRVGGAIEDFLRGSQLIGDLRRGVHPAEAGRRVKETHFDYSDLTSFERNVLRRFIPFYTYMSRNLPLQVRRATSYPGGIVGQMRLMSAGRDPEDYVPDYLSGGAAIPTGPERGGKRQFVSGFGTPLEEALERFKFKGGMPDVRGTAFAFGGSLNPLIKGPLEQLFNVQLHTGRKLSDLRPPATATALGSLIGEENPQLLSQILVNTPFTRFVTGFDRLADPRKTWLAKAANLGTGLKITDVDLARTRAAEEAQARNEILSMMPHVKSYQSYYVKPGDEANLRPDEVEMLRMLATQGRAAKKAAEVRRRQGR